MLDYMPSVHGPMVLHIPGNQFVCYDNGSGWIEASTTVHDNVTQVLWKEMINSNSEHRNCLALKRRTFLR